MRFSHGMVPAVLALALLTTGCRDSATGSSESKKTSATSAAADTKVASAAKDDPPVVAGKASKTNSPQAMGKGLPEAGKKTAPSEPFEPPFAHRVDLFAPPSRGANQTVKNDEQNETIELQGFVNVDGVRAVLAIDNIVAPIAEGEERFGIQVIAIQPPKVVLQRGRQRWTTTLDN